MTKKIALVTGSHLSSNPRLVKEAQALLTAGYDVQILCVQHLSYLSEFDKDIFKVLAKARIHIINFENKGIKSKYFRYLSALRLQLQKLGWIRNSFGLNLLKYSRMFPEMKNELKKMHADIFIGHTLAALPAVAWAAKYHHTKYAFDAEDFHRGESNIETEQNEVINLEDNFLPNSSYISTASPIATNNYKKLYPNSTVFTINNVFPLTQPSFLAPHKISPLKIVWFSQTIGLNRGLQQFLQALSNLNPNQFELHLRGTCTDEVKNELLAKVNDNWKSRLFFYPQCSSVFLEEWLKNFDIGLALETSETYNRSICISNKIFQYMTIGLAIIATATEGQKWVLNQAPDIGVITEISNMTSVSAQLKFWAENPEQLKTTKEKSLDAAQSKFNWDLEKDVFLSQLSFLFAN